MVPVYYSHFTEEKTDAEWGSQVTPGHSKRQSQNCTQALWVQSRLPLLFSTASLTTVQASESSPYLTAQWVQGIWKWDEITQFASRSLCDF